MRFPSASCSAAPRTLTGTIARRPASGGGSSRASSSARSPPVAAASATSLTVPPSARLMALRSSSAGVGHGEAALLADRAVERRVRRGADLVAQQELGERPAAARELRQLGGMQHGVDAGADAVQQRGRQVREPRAVVACRRGVAAPGAAGPDRGSRRAAGARRRPSRRRRPCSDGSCSPAPSGRPRALRAAPSPRAACRARAGATRTRRPIRSAPPRRRAPAAPPAGRGAAMSKASSGTQLGQVRPPVVGSERRWR